MAKSKSTTVNATGKLVRRNGSRKPASTPAPVVAPTTTPALPTPTAATMPDAVIAAARGVTIGNVVALTRAAVNGATVGNRSVGRYTGMRIQSFQNASMEWNRTWQLDDVQLAYVWTVEFPAAIGRVFALNGRMAGADNVNATTVVDVIGIIRGVRAHYNRTGHHGPVPSTPSTSFGPTGRLTVATPTPAAPVVNATAETVAKTKRTRVRKTA